MCCTLLHMYKHFFVRLGRSSTNIREALTVFHPCFPCPDPQQDDEHNLIVLNEDLSSAIDICSLNAASFKLIDIWVGMNQIQDLQLALQKADSVHSAKLEVSFRQNKFYYYRIHISGTSVQHIVQPLDPFNVFKYKEEWQLVLCHDPRLQSWTSATNWTCWELSTSLSILHPSQYLTLYVSAISLGLIRGCQHTKLLWSITTPTISALFPGTSPNSSTWCNFWWATCRRLSLPRTCSSSMIECLTCTISAAFPVHPGRQAVNLLPLHLHYKALAD